MDNILIFIVFAFTVYLSVIMVHRINTVVLKDAYRKVFRYELLVCACFMLLVLDMRFDFLSAVQSQALHIVGWALRAVLLLVCGFMLFLLGKVTVGSFIHTKGRAKHVIVLGLALENGRPTDDLLARLDAAERYVQENPEAVLILTGGNPDESGKTEAAVMRELLLERGIQEQGMILEDQAETTRENFRNTVQLLDPKAPIVLITSNYHMDRAVQNAKSAGFTKILRLPAPSSIIFFGANVMWEGMLELNELTLKQSHR